MDAVAGQVKTGFEAVRDAFSAGHPPAAGGAQLCVYRHGSPVIDIWVGRDLVNDRPYRGDTLTVLMSCTKAAAAICVHMLCERGELDLETPIASWWPEFAQSGKSEITLAHVLSHTSGLFGYAPDSGMDGTSALDWDLSAAALAQMRPHWRPGTAYLYHFFTYGFLLGEAVRRATGRSLSRVLAEEVAGPLGLELWIGLPLDREQRVAPHMMAPAGVTADDLRRTFVGLNLDPEDRLIKALIQTFDATNQLIDIMRTRAGRAAEIPAANAVGDARSLARMYAACIGEVDGVRLLRPETVELMRRPMTDHLRGPPPLPQIGDDPQRFGLGFELPRRQIPMLGPQSFGHPGAGGRIGFADPASGCAVGYACTGMLWDGRTPDPRWVGWMSALADAVRN